MYQQCTCRWWAPTVRHAKCSMYSYSNKMSKVAFLKISECYAYDYVPFFFVFGASKNRDTWEWGYLSVVCLWSYCVCRLRWCKTSTQNLHSSVHAWPFIVLLTTPSQVYFLMIAEYGEGRQAWPYRYGRIFLECKLSWTVHAMVYEESSLYSQAILPDFQDHIWEWLGNKVMEDQDTLVVRVVDFWCSIHLAVLGGRIPACETPFGRHHVTRL